MTCPQLFAVISSRMVNSNFLSPNQLRKARRLFIETIHLADKHIGVFDAILLGEPVVRVLFKALDVELQIVDSDKRFLVNLRILHEELFNDLRHVLEMVDKIHSCLQFFVRRLDREDGGGFCSCYRYCSLRAYVLLLKYFLMKSLASSGVTSLNCSMKYLPPHDSVLMYAV